MAFDFKTATPDTSFAPATAFLFGAGSQAATDPSIFAGSVLVTAFMGGLASADAIKWNNDAILTRAAAATLQLGAADAAAPVAQTFQVQSVVAGTSNTAGADFSIYGSKSTGSGAGGSIKFYTSPAGGAGTLQNAGALALTIDSAKLATFTGSINVGSTSVVAGTYMLTGTYIVDVSGSDRIALGSTFLNMGSGVSLGWMSTVGGTNSGSPDTILARDAANTLALRNGTNAQEFRVYKTTTSNNYKAILGDGNLMKISGYAFTDGAGASAGTLANAPAVGNPTKWIPIDDNGTTRYIPAW